MSQSTSHKELKSSSIREMSHSHIGNSHSQSIHQTPSKSHKENSSLRNYYNSASYGVFLRSEMSENIYQEERKESLSHHPKKRSNNQISLVNQKKLNRPKMKHQNKKIQKLIPKYDQMVKGNGIVKWKKMAAIKSRSVPGSPNSKSEYPVIDEGFANELNKKFKGS